MSVRVTCYVLKESISLLFHRVEKITKKIKEQKITKKIKEQTLLKAITKTSIQHKRRDEDISKEKVVS